VQQEHPRARTPTGDVDEPKSKKVQQEHPRARTPSNLLSVWT